MASTRWGTSKNADAHEARERILDAASRCFDRIGVRKTTMSIVANEARVTRTTLYRYVGPEGELREGGKRVLNVE